MNFAIDEIGLKEEVTGFATYLEEVLKGNTEIVDEIKYKYSKEFIEKLDNKCADLEENLFKLEPSRLFDEEVVSIEETEELFEKH